MLPATLSFLSFLAISTWFDIDFSLSCTLLSAALLRLASGAAPPCEDDMMLLPMAGAWPAPPEPAARLLPMDLMSGTAPDSDYWPLELFSFGWSRRPPSEPRSRHGPCLDCDHYVPGRARCQAIRGAHVSRRLHQVAIAGVAVPLKDIAPCWLKMTFILNLKNVFMHL